MHRVALQNYIIKIQTENPGRRSRPWDECIFVGGLFRPFFLFGVLVGFNILSFVVVCSLRVDIFLYFFE